MLKWTVEISQKCELKLKVDIKNGNITSEDIKVIKRWVIEVETEGIEAAQNNVTWRDHILDGLWAGCRAISFSFSGRLLYKVEKDRVIVRVIRVTHNHDYRKRQSK